MTTEEIKLQSAIQLIKDMAAVIRYLDENSSYCQYWLNDGNENGSEYVPAAIDLGLIK